MAPSTFASAAAGNSTQSSRPDGVSGEWSRRANGATQTFRRPSLATSISNSPHQRDGSATSNAGVYIPPHVTRNGTLAEARYSKDQLLSLFREQKDTDAFSTDPNDLYVGGWEPHIANGTSSSSWGKSVDQGANTLPGADICWDDDGSVLPLGLIEMTDHEKEMFATSVNSTLKPPQPPTNKDGTPKDGLSMRKGSVSQAQNSPGGYGLTSPTSTRPTGRRREPSESYPFPRDLGGKPDGSRFSREEPHAATPPPALLRRRTDFKDNTPDDKDKDKKDGDPSALAGLGSLRRSVTAGTNAPSSPWSATTPSSSFSPMGAFTNLGLGSQPSEKRPSFSSQRSESRFKGLLSKDLQDLREPEEKPSLSKLTESSEAEAENQPPSWTEARTHRPLNNDNEPYLGKDAPSGSAALGGGLDASPPRNKGALVGLGTPAKQVSGDESGFSAFGMTADPATFRDGLHGRQDHFQQTPNQRSVENTHEPMSPTDTNPYQSPEYDKREREDDVDALGGRPQANTFGLDHGPSALPGLGGFDRSQTSSTGPSRGFPSLSGLGGLPGLGSSTWPNQPGGIGTPSQDRKFAEGFGDAGLGPLGELHSPGLAGLGSSSTFSGLGGSGTLGRGSKMGALFPGAMQDQLRTSESRGHVDDGSLEGPERQQNAFGAFGRGPFSAAPGSAIPARDTESPFRATRGIFEEALAARSPFGAGTTSSAAMSTPTAATANQGAIGQVQGPNRGSTSSSASNQPPALQQRQMVMPDRMRWMYKDPQGNQQGPWSGLEMHEWYRNGFFSPDLQVKKEEDVEFEPLAHLIRRIGNSREPFLVPQIGIPHGPPAAPSSSAWTSSGVAAPGGAQPPFASSFPSFGTTLTAEQQNALERRKQEEQYLMAKQKEHLAQQQLIARQIHTNQGLHHHGSAHSLHSQPSYGSITSPGGFQQSPAQPAPGAGGMPGFFDGSFPPRQQDAIGPQLGMMRNTQTEDLPDFMERLNMRAAQGSIGAPGQFPFQQQQQSSDGFAQQLAAEQRARLQREQQEFDALQQRLGNDQVAGLESAQRLQDFHDLRAQEEEQTHASSQAEDLAALIREQQQQQQNEVLSAPLDNVPNRPQREMSLTEQVQQAQSEKQQRQLEEHKPQQPWATKIDTNVPVHPFPPPTSQSPMPAPVAQRKQNLADQLNAESRSQTETPSVDTPSASIAPWAKEAAEQQPKGPSLKEIQEAEAKKAAEREAVEAAARRAQAEKEMLAAATVAAPAPGLPSGATWASGSTGSPSSATGNGPVAWAKPLAGKTQAAPSSAKKTLQQIQKEEEARKQRAVAAAAAASTVVSQPLNGPGGKRYADLASKATASPAGGSNASSGAWTTVGSSGKPKAPTIATGPPPAPRNVSGAALPTKGAASAVAAKVSTPVKDKMNAQEELRRWMVGELRADLSKGVSAEEFVGTLLSLPSEKDLIVEAVHSVSHTIDSRHFAEEFMRRRKLADKGIVDSSHVASPGAHQADKQGGGWSEVAKKGPQAKPEEPNNFRVVAAKKKGGKR